MDKLKTICIKTNGQAEELAAMLFLSKISGIEIAESVLKDAIKGIEVGEYPYIGIGSELVDAYCTHREFNKVFEFSELGKIEEWLNKPEAPVVRMGQKFGFEGETYIVAKVGGKLGLVNIKSGNVWDSDLWVLDKNNPTLEDVAGEDWTYFKKIA